MEEIGGVWYMKGCDADSPDCLHSPEELAEYICRVGFLPLFANEISGFSVEEHTPAAWWWSDDPKRDPWAWRQILAPRKELAYGKFFDRKAGFVSAEWFPVLANTRRDGYDFDARYEDGLSSKRDQKLMNALEPDEQSIGLSLLSCDLKRKAGFGKGGEANYEGVLTRLQMQTYLLVGDFHQRQNRAGFPYGWHLSLIQTPETKWSYEAVTSCYGQSPAESHEAMLLQLCRMFPSGSREAFESLIRGL